MGKWGFMFLFLLGIGSVKSQNCLSFFKESCISETTKFKYQTNEASTAFSLSSNGFWEMPFMLIENKDYRFTLCSDEVFEGIVLFVIKKEDGGEMYNNSQHQFQKSCEFSSVKTQQIILQITAPQPSYGISDTVFAEGCIAIKIEEMKTVHTGF